MYIWTVHYQNTFQIKKIGTFFLVNPQSETRQTS